MLTPCLSAVGDLDILNESELRALESSSGDDCDMAAVRCVVRELRERRSRDLDAEGLKALGWVRALIIDYYRGMSHNVGFQCALAVLNKLTKRGER